MDELTNLFKETVAKLKLHGKSPEDVLWVGAENDIWVPWEDWEKVANYDYNAGYGAPEVATDLKVVGADWWLERHEYDGSEWWEFKSQPVRPKTRGTLKAVCINQSTNPDRSCGWENLSVINKGVQHGSN